MQIKKILDAPCPRLIFLKLVRRCNCAPSLVLFYLIVLAIGVRSCSRDIRSQESCLRRIADVGLFIIANYQNHVLFHVKRENT